MLTVVVPIIPALLAAMGLAAPAGATAVAAGASGTAAAAGAAGAGAAGATGAGGLAVGSAVRVAAGAGARGSAARGATGVARANRAQDLLKAVPRPGWQAPLAGPLRLKRAFDPPAERWNAGHRGVDLEGAVNSVVRAPANGVVVFAGRVAGKPVVSLQHTGGVRTTYEPVRALVKVGQPVGRGASIGRLDPRHCPPGVCLHWGARQGGEYIDPLSLLRQESPVLLPVP